MYQEAASSINYPRRDQCESVKEKKELDTRRPHRTYRQLCIYQGLAFLVHLSNTSLTFLAIAVRENGFGMKAVPRSNTP
jgi:hypothetical protein